MHCLPHIPIYVAPTAYHYSLKEQSYFEADAPWFQRLLLLRFVVETSRCYTLATGEPIAS